MSFLRWPTELNALQLKKINADRHSTSKLRKHLHQFDNTQVRKHNRIQKTQLHPETLQVAQRTTENLKVMNTHRHLTHRQLQ